MALGRPMSREGLPPGVIGIICGEPDPERRERLAEAYRAIPIPPALRVKLEGTPAQIKAAKEYERDVTLVAESDDMGEEGRASLPEWDVELHAHCSMTVHIHAASKEHAERLVDSDDFDPGGFWEPSYGGDWDVRSIRKATE